MTYPRRRSVMVKRPDQLHRSFANENDMVSESLAKYFANQLENVRHSDVNGDVKGWRFKADPVCPPIFLYVFGPKFLVIDQSLPSSRFRYSVNSEVGSAARPLRFISLTMPYRPMVGWFAL